MNTSSLLQTAAWESAVVPNPRTRSTVTYTVIMAFSPYVTTVVQDSSRHTLLFHADLKHTHRISTQNQCGSPLLQKRFQQLLLFTGASTHLSFCPLVPSRCPLSGRAAHPSPLSGSCTEPPTPCCRARAGPWGSLPHGTGLWGPGRVLPAGRKLR